MDQRKQQLNQFFKLYANRFNARLNGDNPDINEILGSFTNCFVGANPLGINCGKNNEEFREAMIQGFGFYKSIGIKSMDIVSLETTVLDKFHEMTKICWKSSFIRKDNSEGSVEFENFYFTQTKENEHKIFAYITGDEQAVLKENELI